MTALTTLVVPTVGRPSLRALLDSLAAEPGPLPEVIVVDDRPDGGDLDVGPDVRVLRSGGRGPAAARNTGWRAATTPWVSFVDDDVLLRSGWLAALEDDLAKAADDVVAVEGRVTVPLPTDRRPRDFERSTAGLESARWITADMSVRRSALVRVGGFDERFRRAYREDADLGLRLSRHGRIVEGRREVLHPVRPEDDAVSVRQQRGNADDVLMRAIHGRDWREQAGAPRGALRWHVATAAAGLAAPVLLLARRRRAAAAAAAAWAALTARFAWARIAPGPRDADEVRRMVRTSVVIPFAATAWSLRGRWMHRGAGPMPRRPALVLLDRDGTLVHDVPYNDDPELVRPVDDAVAALERLRAAGIATGIVTNQSGVARGLIDPGALEAVNARVEELLGPFDVWQVCPHGPDDDCACRKPRPGMVEQAARDLGLATQDVVVIGDIGADVEAARAAGAVGILVPNAATRPEEVAAAERVHPDLGSAVDAVLGGRW